MISLKRLRFYNYYRNYDYRYDFTCSIAQHCTSTDRQIIEGSFEAYYQLTDNEIKFEIAENYVPKGYCSVSDFEWKEIKL